MPVFGFRKEGFDPDLSFAQCLLISEGLVVAPHPFEIVGMKRAMHLPTVVTGSTLRFEWTGITGGWVPPILRLLGFVLHPRQAEWLTMGADVGIVCRIVGKPRGSIIAHIPQFD